MKKIVAIVVALLAAFTFALAVPSSASSRAAAPTSISFFVKQTCTTNANGYCRINHNLGVVPDAVQAQTVNRNSLATTSLWTTTSVDVRIAKRINTSNGVDAWSNLPVEIVLLGMYTPGTVTPTTPVPTTTAPAPTTPAPTTPIPTTPNDPPVDSDYPTATNTGVPAGTELTTHSGDLVITTANTVVDKKKVTGMVDIRAPGVVIKNSEIVGRVINDNIATHNAFTIQDSQVGSATACSTWQNGAIGIENYTAIRVKLLGFVDGFRVAGGNILIQDNFVKLCGSDPVYHSDGIQGYGAENGKNIVIKHNVIDQRSVLSEAQTSPIFFPNDGPHQFNQNLDVRIDDNVVAGGGYAIRLFGDLPFTSPSVSGNKIVNNSWGYGPFDLNCSRIGAFTGNAVVTYDWTNGKVLSEVRKLNDCATAPTTTPPPASTEFPNASNTGVPAGTALTALSCPSPITVNNTVIDSKTINCDIEVRATGVVISKSKVTGSVYTPDGATNYSFRLEDSEVSYPTITGNGRTMIGEAGFTVLRSEITGGNRGIYCRENCTVKDSYVHGILVRDSIHASGIRVSQGATLTHNTIHCDAEDVGEAGCSANLTGYPDFEAVKNNTITGNLFKATPGGFCAYGGATGSKPFSSAADNATNIVFKDNVFERGTRNGDHGTPVCGYYGPITDFNASRTGNVWSNNKWDNGTVINP